MEDFGFKCFRGTWDQHRDACIKRLIDEHGTKGNPSEPANKALYNRVVREAKKKFDVWPSVYASSWVVREYKKRGGRYANPLTGLDKWFAEEWVDLGRSIDSKGHVKKWVECGRPDASKGKYPKCVPLAKAKKMTPKQRLDAVKRKRAAEKTALKTKGRKPVMVKTLKKNPKKNTKKDPFAEEKAKEAHLIKEVFDSLSKEEVKLLGGKEKAIDEIFHHISTCRGQNIVEEKYIADYVMEMLDYDVQELMAKAEENPKGKAPKLKWEKSRFQKPHRRAVRAGAKNKKSRRGARKRNPTEFLPVVMYTGKGFIGDQQVLYTVAGSAEKSFYDVHVFARPDGGAVVKKLEKSWASELSDPEEAARLAAARMIQETGVSIVTKNRMENMIPKKNPGRGRRKNPPIDLDYLDKMMGKEDAASASEGIKKSGGRRDREEKKRIKAFLKEGGVEQDWEFTYDPVWETYEIKNELYGRAEIFDTFEEAADRLKYLDRPISMGVLYADATLSAPEAGESAAGTESSARNFFVETYGFDDERNNVATAAFSKYLDNEFSSSPKDYLPPGFTVTENDNRYWSLRGPEGQIGDDYFLTDAIDKAWEIHRGPVDNPKRRKKTSKKRAKKPQHRKLIDTCRKHWEAYCERPNKTNLKKVFKHLEKMAESSAKSVKDERRKCLRVAKLEAKELGIEA